MPMTRPNGKLGPCHRCGETALCRDDIGRSCHSHCYGRHYDEIQTEIQAVRRKGFEVTLKSDTCSTCMKPILRTNIAGEVVALDLESPRLVEEVRLIVAGRRTFGLFSMEVPNAAGSYTCSWVMPRQASDIKPGDPTTVLVEHEHKISAGTPEIEINKTTPPRTTVSQTTEVARAQVAAAFAVPPRLLGIDAASPHSTIVATLSHAGRALPAWEVAQVNQMSVSEVLKELEALRDAGKVERLAPSGTGDPVRWAALLDSMPATEVLASQESE